MDIANLSLVRKINYSIIWTELVKSKENTIIGLKKLTGLSFPTINRAVDFGKELGIIIDGEIEESNVGRKAQMYKINNNFYHSLAIIADDDKLTYNVFDIVGNKLKSGKLEGHYSDLIANVEQVITSVVEEDSLVTVMSMAVIGVVDNGIVIDCSANPALSNFDLKGYFERKFNMLVEISNNINTVASSLIHQFRDDDVSSFAVLDYGYSGFGVSLVSDGKVIYGKNGFSGEIYYLADGVTLKDNHSLYKSFILPIVTVIAPKQIYLYTTFGQDLVSEMTEFVKKSIPSYAMPKIIVRDDILDDMMKGLFMNINDSKLASLL